MARSSLSTPVETPRRYDQERTSPIRRYEDDTWVKLRVALEGVRLRFPSNTDVLNCLEQLERTNSRRHSVYQEAWTGWVTGSTPEERWKVGGKNRRNYDELLDEFLLIRGTCTQMLELALHAHR
jgi:hypothetical protein